MYAKIRKSMWEGSLAGTGETWAVFVYLLANSDPKGFVDVHPKVISRMTGFSDAAVAKALGELEAADFSSRTPDAEGRRIVRVDEHRVWGWHITNYEKYRTEKDLGTVREQAAARQRRFRDKNNVTVTLRNAPSRQEEVEEEVSKNTPSPVGSGTLSDKGKSPHYSEGFEEFWVAYKNNHGRREEKPKAFAEWKRQRCEPIRIEVLIALGSFKSSQTWRDGFMPYPAKWLKGRPWDNPIEPDTESDGWEVTR